MVIKNVNKELCRCGKEINMGSTSNWKIICYLEGKGVHKMQGGIEKDGNQNGEPFIHYK